MSYIGKNFIPFGGGSRSCAGAEFSKVVMAIFFHVLVTEYRYYYQLSFHFMYISYI